MNAVVVRAPIAPTPARIADPNNRRDRLVAALLGYRTAIWDDSTGHPAGHPADADSTTERARARDRIRAVQNVKARRRRRKLGALGGRRMS